jgi:hypothetical protein
VIPLLTSLVDFLVDTEVPRCARLFGRFKNTALASSIGEHTTTMARNEPGIVPHKCGSRTHSPARPTRDELSEPLDFLDCYCIDEQTHQNVWSRYKIFMTLSDLTRCKARSQTEVAG